MHSVVAVFLSVAPLLPSHASSSTTPPATINVNTASETQLMTVPGVTRDVARRIVQHRPFASIDQLVVEADLPAETVRVARTRLALFTTHVPPPRGDGSAPADQGPRAMDPALSLIDVNLGARKAR